MDPNSLLSQVQFWFNESQYEPIVHMLEILIESPNGSVRDLELNITSTKELAAQQTKSLLFAYFGDSLYRLKYFRRALRAYEQSLSFNDSGSRRASKRYKTSTSLNNSCDITKMNAISINNSENELKHRIHLCHLELNEIRDARMVLERIPPPERSLKILSSLADLYYRDKNNEKAKDTYLEIIKQDPLRLDCVTKLCRLGGCSANKILDLISDDFKKNYSWYPSWIQAQCYLHSSNSKQAIKLLENLTSRFERKAPLVTCLATAHYHDGNFKEAIRIFQSAYNNDPLTLAGVGSYAACLHKESSFKETLEDLAVNMGSKCSIEGEYFHEPWLVLAHYYASNDKKEPKALLFVQKAYKLNRYSIESLILLACLCLEKKDTSKALSYIMSAQIQAPYRYEVQRILCDAFIADNKKPSALKYAKAAVECLGKNARSYYLWADVKLRSTDQRVRNSARTCLEKAIELDRTYLPAILSLAELLIDEKKFDKALEVLKAAYKHEPHRNEVALLRHISTCYIEKNEKDAAIFYTDRASFLSSKQKRSDSTLRVTQEQTPSQDQIEQTITHLPGLEADEHVDDGDSD